MTSFTRALARRDLHNASIDFKAALAGYCAFTHLASGRTCRLPHGHVDSCRFVQTGRRDVPEPASLLSVSAGREDDQRRLVVAVSGEIDAYTAPLLSSVLCIPGVGGTIRELVVDMEHVSFLGGAGLSALTRARRECLQRGIRLVIRGNGRRAVIRPLHLAGLSELLATDPAVEESAAACVVDLSDRRTDRASRPENRVPTDGEGVGSPPSSSGAGPRRERHSMRSPG